MHAVRQAPTWNDLSFLLVTTGGKELLVKVLFYSRESRLKPASVGMKNVRT